MASSVLGAMSKKSAEVKPNSSGSPASEVPKNGQKTPIAPPPSLPSTSGIVTSKKEENGAPAPPPFNRKRHDSQGKLDKFKTLIVLISFFPFEIVLYLCHSTFTLFFENYCMRLV